MPTRPSRLESVLRAVTAHHASMSGWTWGIDVHPKWHKKDRAWIRTASGSTVFEAHFRIRKDGIGLLFHKGDEHWHEAVMEEWGNKCAISCVLTCVFWHAVPAREHRSATTGCQPQGPNEKPNPLSNVELKPIQHGIRKSKTGWSGNVWPPAVASIMALLEKRHAELSGVDVEEGIRKLEYPFRFLISKGVPFERIRRAWDEAKVAEVMKS